MAAYLLDEDALLALLAALSRDDQLREQFVLKGGNALRYAYEGVRSSVDVDLTSTEPHPNQPAVQGEAFLEDFSVRLGQALSEVASDHGFARMVVQSTKVLPHKKDPRRFPALQVTVGYTRRVDRDPPYSEAIGLDISLNDVVCEWEDLPLRLSASSVSLRVSTLDDILAEKLRALLQQVPRKRNRPADVFDLWYYLTRARRLIAPSSIGRFLREKSADKEGLGRVTRAMFDDPEVRRRAQIGYADIQPRLREGVALPPFAEAFAVVLTFVDELGLPAE